MTEIVAARLGYGWGWDLGENGWKPGLDQNFRMSDTFLGLTIIDDSLTAPPGSPADGDTYIPHATATGAWATHEGKIAAYQAGTWYFYSVVKGLRALFAASSTFKYYTGSVWTAEPSSAIWNAGSVAAISSDFTLTSNTLALAATLDLSGHTEVKVPAPVNSSDAVTKLYADTAIQGLSIKPTAVVATITTLPTYTYSNGTAGVGATITASATGTLTIDGHLTALNDVILVKNETSTNAPNNGLYRVTTAGAGGVAFVLTREVDMDSSAEFTGALTAVGEVSTTYPGTLWICNQTAPTVGTTNIAFTQISAVAASQWNAGTVTAIKTTQLEIVSGTLDIKSGATLDATVHTGGVSTTGGTTTDNLNVSGTLTALPISSHFSLNAGTLSLKGTLDLSTLSEVKVPVGANATDATQKTYVDNATGLGLILQGYLSGLITAWVSNTSFSVATGQAMSDDNTTMMTLGSALTKTTSAWAAGTAAGGLDTGSIGVNSWYFVYVIYNTGSPATDILFSLSATSPTMPSGYTKKRRIGAILTSASNFVKYIQTNDRFDWGQPINGYNNFNLGVTTAVTKAVAVPLGIVVEAILDVIIADTSASTTGIYLSSLATTDVAVTGSTGETCITAGASGTFGMAAGVRVITDTSQQIRVRANSTTQDVFLNTIGWIDKRGANSSGSGSVWNAGLVNALNANQLTLSSGTLQFVTTPTITNLNMTGTLAAVPLKGNAIALNNGSIQVGGTLALNATASATLTLAPTADIKDVIVTMPAAGGAVTFALAGTVAAYQEWKLHIKQGATASTLTLNSGFVFAPSGGPSSFTLTPTANDRDILWMQNLDGTHAVVGAVLQGLTI